MSRDTFHKTVSIKAVDEEERTATGAVLVPNQVDRQRDFVRPDAIRTLFNPDPDDGVMHTAFPDGAAELVRNEVIDDPEVIGGEQFPAGTWVATRRYDDEDLWQLVEDGILTGFSIGGNVSDEFDYSDPDEMPESVTFPDGIERGPATEILDGTVNEVSDVDIPAVPAATYRELGKLGKNTIEDIDGQSEFVDMMVERGHDEADAERLWNYLVTRTKCGPLDAVTTAETPSSPIEDVEVNAETGEGGGEFDGDTGGVERCPSGEDGRKSVTTRLVTRLRDRFASAFKRADDSNTGRFDTTKLLDEARRPTWSGRAPGDNWDRPALGNYVEAYYNGDVPDDQPIEWAELPPDVRMAIAERSLLGDPDADTYDDGVAYPVVYPDGRLSEDALTSARQLAGRAEGATESIRTVTEDLLESEFEYTFDDDKKMTNDDLEDADDETLGRLVRRTLFGTSDEDQSAAGGAAGPDGDADGEGNTEKAGRTLSKDNVRRAKAQHDMAEKMLEAEGVTPHKSASRTYKGDDTDPFALDDAMKVATGGVDGPASEESGSNDGDGESTAKHTSSDEIMTDDDNEAPEWAKSMEEQLDDIEQRVDAIEDDDGDAAKSADDDDAGDDDGDVPEYVEDLGKQVEELADRVEQVSKATGATQQSGGGESSPDDDGLTEKEKAKRELFLPN